MPKASPPKRAELRNPIEVTSVSSGRKSDMTVKIAVNPDTNTAAQNASWIAFCANLRLLTFGQNQAAVRFMLVLSAAEVTTRNERARS